MIAEWVGLAAALTAAGLVYGFAGFGAALIFMPIGARLTSPVEAAAIMSLTALGSAVTVLPDAVRQADRRAAGTILIAALSVMPAGVWVLRTADPDVLRWAVSGIVLLTLGALLSGWRLKGRPGPASWIAVGAGVGFAGGSTGLNGPPLVLFQLAGSDGAARARANTITVLTLTGLALLPLLMLQGGIDRATLILGLVLAPVYGAASYAGRRLFDPAQEGLYRRVAYAVVAVAAVAGLPVW